MNIFLLDDDPVLCARYTEGRYHLNKMITEHVQMLSAAVRNPDGGPIVEFDPILRADGTTYMKPLRTAAGIDAGMHLNKAHMNHGCTIWARTSLTNWRYLRELTEQLFIEKCHRSGLDHMHASIAVMRTLPEPNVPDIGFTDPYEALPDEMKQPCYVASYREYYVRTKDWFETKYGIVPANWIGRGVPHWYPALAEELGVTILERDYGIYDGQ